MKKIATILVLLITSLPAFADRYIEDSAGSSSGGFFNIIFGIIFSILALLYLVHSFSKWKDRQEKNEKPEPLNDAWDWGTHLFGYAIVAIFACMSVLLISRIFFDAIFVREYWYWVFLICFGLITYFKRT